MYVFIKLHITAHTNIQKLQEWIHPIRDQWMDGLIYWLKTSDCTLIDSKNGEIIPLAHNTRLRLLLAEDIRLHITWFEK